MKDSVDGSSFAKVSANDPDGIADVVSLTSRRLASTVEVSS